MKWLNLFLASMFCFAIAGCGGEEGVVPVEDEAVEQAMEDEYSAAQEDYENEQ